MVYCVQARLAFSTAARRDSVLADIQARVAGKPRWGVEELAAADLRPRAGQFGIRLALRFVSRADEEDLLVRLDSFATGVRTPLAGSWLTLHDCTHDEQTNGCAVTATRGW